MKSITLTDKNRANFLTDIEDKRDEIERIQKAFEMHEDLHVTDIEAYVMWKSYSKMWAASWLRVSNDYEKIIDNLLPFYRVDT